MPHEFPCPQCGEKLETFMRPGESATCAACGREVVVPDDAIGTEPALPPPLLPWQRPNRTEVDTAAAAATWLPRMGVGLIAMVVLLFFVTIPRSGSEEAFWFLWLPFLFLGAIVMVSLGFTIGALNGIRDELRAHREEPPTES